MVRCLREFSAFWGCLSSKARQTRKNCAEISSVAGQSQTQTLEQFVHLLEAVNQNNEHHLFLLKVSLGQSL